MKRLLRLLGSIQVAAPLLITIAAVLAWGTIYEARFGTAAVQRTVYQAWWFQTLLGFLAVNLAVAAFERYPWKRQHLPFVLAHIGIILVLLGGIIGGRFGIDGQLIIPEQQAERLLQLSRNVLVVRQPNPGVAQVLPTNFESRAWVHEPNTAFQVPLTHGVLTLTVDRYYPDAQFSDEVSAGGADDNPAIRVRVSHEGQQEETWLLSRDPDRFGMRWGELHLLFLEPSTEAELEQLTGEGRPSAARGVVSVTVPGETQPREIPVPETLGRAIPIRGTRYTVTFRDYFPDFALSEQGPVSRSDEPNNPAVAFILSGPEGTDAHLLFAFHPDFPEMHGRSHVIDARVAYAHPAGGALPPDAFVVIRSPAGPLIAVLTGAAGERLQVAPIAPGGRVTHPSLGYECEVMDWLPRAVLTQRVSNRSNEIHAEAVHVVLRLGDARAEAWLGLRQTVTLPLGGEPVELSYRPGERELPVTIKLSDFRKTTYPGIDMPAAFESDVQLTDPERGVILMRKISMNHPLRYRGYTFYQSSYIPGAVETTVLSVRNDPGTPLVYAGFLIIIAGVVSMFLQRQGKAAHPVRPKGKGVAKR